LTEKHREHLPQRNADKINSGVAVLARNEAICFSNFKNVDINKADCFKTSPHTKAMLIFSQ
jgi:hypothetical protein